MDQQPGAHPQEPWKLLALTIVFQLLFAFAYATYPPLVERIREDLSLSYTQISLLPFVLSLSGMVIGPLAGWQVDRLSPRHLFLFLVLSLSGLAALIGLVPVYPTLLLGLTLMGVVYAVVSPITNKVLVVGFSPARQGTALSAKQSAVTLGMALASFALPYVAVRWHWSAAFLVVSATVLVVGMVVLGFYPETGADHQTEADHREQPDHPLLGDAAAILHTRQIWPVLASGIFFHAVQNSVLTFMVPILENRFLFMSTVAGAILAVAQLSGAGARPFLGWISDQYFRRRRLTSLALVGITSSLVVASFALLPAGAPFQLVVISCLLVGATAFGWNGVYFTVLTSLVDGQNAGLATGISMVGINLGGAFGPVIVGYLADLSGDFRQPLLILAGLLLSINLYNIVYDARLTGHNSMKPGKP